MELIIRNNTDQPIYGQITSQIRAQILSGALAPGDALPSIRALAKDLKISVITTKRAYDELEAEGFVCTVAGKGCFACEKPSQAWEEEDQLMKQFTQTAQQLLALGHTRQELAARLVQEDHYA